MMNELGRLPVVGDEVPLQGGTLRVERLEGRRVDRIRYTPDPEIEGVTDHE
jgi:CBS domain containing-hemolysin-like protein